MFETTLLFANTLSLFKMSEEELHYIERSKLVDGMVELIRIPGIKLEQLQNNNVIQDHK